MCKRSMPAAPASASGNKLAGMRATSSSTASASSSAARPSGRPCLEHRRHSQAGLLSPRQGEAGHQRGRRGKARQEAELRKTLGKLVPTYLALREKGDEYWPKLRPRSLPEVTRYLTRSWQPLHGEPIDRSGRDEIVKESGAVSANRAMGRSALRLGHRSGAPHARQPDGGHQAS